MLMALRKKMRANESAMTSEMPAPRIATGAIYRVLAQLFFIE
jgi:hypothetical protein